MKRALVFGAGGFIGGHLVDQLVADGYWVRGVDLKLTAEPSTANDFLLLDARSPSSVDRAFSCEMKFDEVYQLAADMGGATYINAGIHDADVMSNSVIINANIAKACVRYGVKKLFFSSSACVYPQVERDLSTCYEDDAYPARPDNEYGWEKLFTERMLMSFQRQYGLAVRIARFHSIVGPRSTWQGGKEKAHSALARKVAMVENGGCIEVIGDGTQTRTFLYVTDCVSGIRALMDSDVDTVINIGSDVLISIAEYVELLRSLSGKDFTVKYIPGPTGVKDRHCQVTLASQLIDWRPTTDLRTATSMTYQWIREQILYEVARPAETWPDLLKRGRT
ncbi:GDP-mannose 3,5-epimerase 1 [Tetrabaena socialis]|uniref:GDP-mannose 3,5-epimerase 1 n=1 Tax=Tetrabaena socialis TaxID=47790 RepID=A0A2J7ZL11_9CHLO|nr:GDP-mannose 3,5-epimerase 1 [Tetrabaena socialis]|eukprot:PNH00958.1 GDP-mannose 3,5-epimerase 1 [Tetrabaena socialis]